MPITAPTEDLSPAGAETTGEHHLLLDDQINAATDQTYWHVVKKITGQSGVQNGARLQFQFDPAFQKLNIHVVRIIRDGQNLDRLEPQKFKIIQQESGLERHMFNGELSAVLFLEDVRVGDVIEYSYTTTGSNPILKGHFASSFLLEWSEPVQKQYDRLLWPAGRTLTIKNHHTTEMPVIHKSPGFTEYVWELANIPATVYEDAVPFSAETFGWVQFTDFSSWREVAEWALPLYQHSEPLPADLRRKIDGWNSLPTSEERVSRALRFVQDEVRYLGIEVGPNSQQPNPPDAVFTHRFGDCKDKANLFCAILNAMNIEAYPVLVHSYHGKALTGYAPSPYAFNHVVSQVRLGNRTHWFDTTFAFQRGPLDEIYFPDYANGLVVAPGSDDLMEIPRQKGGLPFTSVYETFRMLNYTNPAVYEVRTIKRGADADLERLELAATTKEELQKAYLNHYARVYPKIKVATPIEIRDDPDKNEISIFETYHIADLWELSEERHKWSFEFAPEDIRLVAQKPQTSLRTLPLSVAYPRHLAQSTTVILAGPANFKNQSEHLQDDAMRLDRTVSYAAPALTVSYVLETFTNQVPVSQVPDHLDLIKRIREKAYFQIERPDSHASPKTYQPNWILMAVAVIYFLFMLVAAAAAYWFRPRNHRPPPLNVDPALTGIGGWLVLLVIRLVIPLGQGLTTLVKFWKGYSLEQWNILTMPGGAAYNANWAPILIFEMLGHITFLVFIPLMLVMLSQKLYALPRYLIVYLAAAAIHPLINHFWLESFHPSSLSSRQIFSFWGPVGFTFVWIAYLLKSQRVKQTFVR